MTTTTQLHSIGSYTMSATLTDFVAGYLGEFFDDYDLDGLVAAYRDGINAELADAGISLHGDDFYSTVPVVEDSRELIKAAIEEVDLAPLAEKFDTSAN